MTTRAFRLLAAAAHLAANALDRHLSTPIPTAWAWAETSCSEPLPGPFDSWPGGAPPVAARPGPQTST
jgi:hypothetical protein